MQTWPSSGFSRVPTDPASRPRSFVSHRREPRPAGGEGRAWGAAGAGSWAEQTWAHLHCRPRLLGRDAPSDKCLQRNLVFPPRELREHLGKKKTSRGILLNKMAVLLFLSKNFPNFLVSKL